MDKETWRRAWAEKCVEENSKGEKQGISGDFLESLVSSPLSPFRKLSMFIAAAIAGGASSSTILKVVVGIDAAFLALGFFDAVALRRKVWKDYRKWYEPWILLFDWAVSLVTVVLAVQDDALADWVTCVFVLAGPARIIVDVFTLCLLFGLCYIESQVFDFFQA